MSTKFKVGDKVFSKYTEQVGVIVCIEHSPKTGEAQWIGAEYPHPTNTEHDLDGNCRAGYGYWDMPSSLTLVGGVSEELVSPQAKLDKLKKYFESGNDVPVQQATIKAKDFWAIYNS